MVKLPHVWFDRQLVLSFRRTNMVVYTFEQRWEILRHYRLTEDADFGKKWSSIWSWRLCKQAKLSHLGHRKPERIHWKADAPKPSHCLGRILVQRHNWAFFFENEQGEDVTVNGDLNRSMLNEFLFTKIEEEDIGNIWFQQNGATCHTAEATLDVLRPVFENRIISLRADVVWPTLSWDLTPLDYYLWGARAGPDIKTKFKKHFFGYLFSAGFWQKLWK